MGGATIGVIEAEFCGRMMHWSWGLEEGCRAFRLWLGAFRCLVCRLLTWKPWVLPSLVTVGQEP